MENQKKQQNFSRLGSKAYLPTDSNRKSVEVQGNKTCRNSRRQQPPAPCDRQRNIKNSSKVRPNVDKRPRMRSSLVVGNSYHDDGYALDDISTVGTRLDSQEWSHSALTENDFPDNELNSVYSSGSKKHNLNHLLNFRYAPREASSLNSNVIYKNHKYNKEQFLQANFQFVIRADAKPKITGSPDTVIDWDLIEQINLQTTEEPQCPICLYPPVAAKLTRCGHAYCWPCILHYLALSDKIWRKCPICYEAVYARDLRSAIVVQQAKINVGNVITFNLMRREKGSLFIEKYKSGAPTIARYPKISKDGEAKFSKFLIATRSNIFEIIERERNELIAKMDASCPETVFIQQALAFLTDREEKLSEMYIADDEGAFEKNPVYSQIRHIDEEIELNVNKVKSMDQAQIRYDFHCTEISDDIIELKEMNFKKSIQINGIETKLSDSSSVSESENNTRKYYYFYQCNDGQNIFLHPLNVKMLQSCYNSLYRSPQVIKATILQTEHLSMDEENRRKFTCLGHLPLTCQFSVVEVDLQPPLVSENVLKIFKDDLIFRKKERQRRDREEQKREKQIAIINDRKMGKLISTTASLNLNSTDDFPTCGFEQSLVSHIDDETLEPPKTSTQTVSYSSVTLCGKSYTKPTPGGIGKTRPTGGNGLNGNVLPMCTKLSDVLEEAISQKKQNSTVCVSELAKKSSKNSKKAKPKKIQPLFSTGINYNGDK